MSIWNRLIGIRNIEDIKKNFSWKVSSVSYDASHYAIIDLEIGFNDKKIHDIGAIRYDGAVYHKASKEKLFDFLHDIDFICGHNIIHHDAKYLFADRKCRWLLVDTLYMSPLMFPDRPYHRLVKDDKLISDDINNPVNDCVKAKDLLLDEIARWNSLPERKRNLFASLLQGQEEFEGFLSMVGADYIHDGLSQVIFELYKGKICEHADMDWIIKQYPCELAYALALVDTTDHRSITPGWVLRNYPEVEFVIKLLRQTPCHKDCAYCSTRMNVLINLKSFFGYEEFRTYEGEPLQEKAAKAAVEGKSLIAIFPTGGGKSLTFQLPALMEGRSVHGLTVVISPLQSLMKDQVDNLADRGITDAVTINGLLDPITRALAINRVIEGEVSLLYIAPEMLRSKTIERILMIRHVVRFVIDEAHCFSSWGHDFRVDYLYIGKFIKEYQQKKGCRKPIPVSCFTATAKQKVIQDIRDYFKNTLKLDLELFASTASRTNLHYSVIHADTDDEKYSILRGLIAESDCPTIIYVSRTRRTIELAAKLTRDGYKALPYNGKMDSDEKIVNQDSFMNDDVRIIVATSAFGIGNLGSYPGFPSGAAGISLGFGSEGMPTGGAAGLATGYAVSSAGIAAMNTASAALGTASGGFSFGQNIVLPLAGMISGWGGLLQAMSPYMGEWGLGAIVAGNLMQGTGNAAVSAYQNITGRITTNADVILSDRVKNIETVCKMLDTQAEIVRKTLKNDIESDSKSVQDL